MGAQMILEATFWLCAALVVYTYLVYPAVVWACSRRVKVREPGAGGRLPTVTVLIAAYNEQAVIRERILDVLALDYPR